MTFGAAPMFFYLLHLYVLKVLYVLAERFVRPTGDNAFALPDVASLWLAALVALGLYAPVRWFAALKARRRDLACLRYLQLTPRRRAPNSVAGPSRA